MGWCPGGPARPPEGEKAAIDSRVADRAAGEYAASIARFVRGLPAREQPPEGHLDEQGRERAVQQHPDLPDTGRGELPNVGQDECEPLYMVGFPAHSTFSPPVPRRNTHGMGAESGRAARAQAGTPPGPAVCLPPVDAPRDAL